ncbi:MAG: 2-amino-4-hydroxy-6-hydroxymethyldihydropteridine diphosphokinase [Pseudonocardiales bacterium]|nr:MAG: 2-amino-4-hydroxy-6-hydroxymethyldihydropteridine diphosphokinase [Pseudonocardiales bacterium]
MSRAVLSIGSNLGEREMYLKSTVDALGSALGKVSPVYETAPWGPVPQPRYLNAVVVVADETDAAGWLRRAHEMESAAGRERAVRWGPRTLDIDVITVDDMRSDDPALTLPHPRAHERAFVLVPWLDVEPEAVLADHGRVADLIRGLDTAGMRRRDDVRLWS